MRYVVIVFCVLMLGCGSSTAPEMRIEVGGTLDTTGHGSAQLPKNMGDPLNLPSMSCYIAPTFDSDEWVAVASSFLTGFCGLFWEEKRWFVEFHDSIPGWAFRAVVIF